MAEKQPKMILLESLIPNPENPRVIRDARFEKLKDSLKRNPKFMELIPMKVDEKGIVIAGNQRRLALIELGYKEIPESWVKYAYGLTPEERKEFILQDNNHFGDYDMNALLDTYTEQELDLIGVEITVVNAEQIFDQPPPSVEENLEHMQKIKDQRAKGNEAIKDKTDTEKYLIIVFDSRTSKEQLLERLGLPKDERYVPANTVTLILNGAFHPITEHKASNRKKSGSQG